MFDWMDGFECNDKIDGWSYKVDRFKSNKVSISK